MSQVFLLRHGITTTPGRFCGSTDTCLSKQGWHQMWAAVEGYDWHRIVSSPARRCREFGIALSEQRSVPHLEDARLREMHFGDWEGLSAAELMRSAPEQLRQFWQDPARYPPPCAESPAAVRARVLAAWNDLSADGQRRQRVLVVTHGGPMRILRNELVPGSAAHLLEIDVPYAALWDMSG